MDRTRVNQTAKALATTVAWVLCWGLFTVSGVGNAERILKATEPGYVVEKEMRQGFVVQVLHFLWQSGKSSYQPVWPVRIYTFFRGKCPRFHVFHLYWFWLHQLFKRTTFHGTTCFNMVLSAVQEPPKLTLFSHIIFIWYIHLFILFFLANQDMEFGWRLVLGTIIGFLGAGLGSVGGVGGGGIFVPMLSLIIGFDPKSSTAISKCLFLKFSFLFFYSFSISQMIYTCMHVFYTSIYVLIIDFMIMAGMIMGAAGSTVYYNLKLRHPTLDMPLIDYDLALLFQPMLMLGISIGVAFNVIFADWMVTVLLIILFIGKVYIYIYIC